MLQLGKVQLPGEEMMRLGVDMWFFRGEMRWTRAFYNTGWPHNSMLRSTKVTPDLWKGIKTVLLEVARDTIGCVKSQKKQKWISERLSQQSGKRRKQKAKKRTDIKN